MSKIQRYKKAFGHHSIVDSATLENLETELAEAREENNRVVDEYANKCNELSKAAVELKAELDNLQAIIYDKMYDKDEVDSICEKRDEYKQQLTAALEREKALTAEWADLQQHENWTHDEMEKIVGNDDSFIFLTRKLQNDFTAALEREKALQREICEQEENLRTGTMTHKTAQQIAKQRGWRGLFDEKGNE